MFTKHGRALPLAAFSLFCLFPLLTVGCAHQNGIVGKWHGSMGAAPAAATIDAEYKADGTATSAIQTSRQTMKMQSTYTQTGDTLTETITGLSVNGMNVPIPATGKTSETRTVKIAGDTLTITDARRPGGLTLTRVH